jgi:hypothetical protein
MHRTLLLMLLITVACSRRETVSGNWTGVAGPDASTSIPTADEGATSGPGHGSPDAAAGGGGKSATDLPPPSHPTPEFLPPDAAAPEARQAGAEDPTFASRDASPDLTDAHPCPDADRCD